MAFTTVIAALVSLMASSSFISAAPTTGLGKLQFHGIAHNSTSTNEGGGCTMSACTKGTDGTILYIGSKLVSASGQYFLDMQLDGNLVLFCGDRAIWDTGTNGLQIKDGLYFRGDGNLVLYRTDGKALWASMTNNKDVDTLIMQDDGNLVLYGGKKAYWSTGTDQICE